ncbi:MAG: hypothetical protein ABSA39_19850 [Edaphobacter sp.]
MKWFGPSALVEVIDRGDELQVNVTQERRGIDFVVLGTFLSVFAFMFWRDRGWIYFVCLLFACAFSLRAWLSRSEEQLLVTETGLEAIGDFGGFSRERVGLPWLDISGLEYQEGGEDEPSGLHARRGGWRSTLLMTHVNKEQAEEIIAAIYHRFSYVDMAEDDGVWLPMGGKSGLTTLGLSKLDRDDAKGAANLDEHSAS